MDTYHDEKEERVWRRVRGEAAQDPPDRGLTGLIARELGTAAVYLALSKRLAGPFSETLRRLHREEMAHAACLRGIHILVTGNRPAVKAPPPVQEAAELTLRRCYSQEMKSLVEYEARSADREYGPVFARLADQEREHCQTLLQLIGSLK